MATSTNLWARLLSVFAIACAVTQTSAVVTGATGVNGTRLEIRTLERNSDQWNMFLLGLSAMQNTTQSNNESHYAISGMLALVLYTDID